MLQWYNQYLNNFVKSLPPDRDDYFLHLNAKPQPLKAVGGLLDRAILSPAHYSGAPNDQQCAALVMADIFRKATSADRD